MVYSPSSSFSTPSENSLKSRPLAGISRCSLDPEKVAIVTEKVRVEPENVAVGAKSV